MDRRYPASASASASAERGMPPRRTSRRATTTTVKVEDSVAIEMENDSGGRNGRQAVAGASPPSPSRKRKATGDSSDDGARPTPALPTAAEDASPSRQKKGEAKVQGSQNARAAIWRKKPSRQALERVKRVLHQRMFLLHRESIASASPSTSTAPVFGGQVFKVLGSTGNVYTVTVAARTSCDCPDAIKNASGVCKHAIFVFLKVLGVAPTDHVWFQKALTPAERQRVFGKANPDPTVSNPNLKRAYLQAIGESAVKEEGKGVHRRLPERGDLCAVCYEEFDAGTEDSLVFCEHSCGNPLHATCADEWRKHCRRQQKGFVCVYCNTSRADVERIAHEVYEDTGQKYLSLADMSNGEVSARRDYSHYAASALSAMCFRGVIGRDEMEYWTSLRREN